MQGYISTPNLLKGGTFDSPVPSLKKRGSFDSSGLSPGGLFSSASFDESSSDHGLADRSQPETVPTHS